MILSLIFAFLLQASAFDVASIRPSKYVGEGLDRDKIEAAPGKLTIRNGSLSSCIQWANSVQSYQISGPEWLGSQRFDITAKTSDSAVEAQLRLMLQTLLKERFKLATHREKRELPVYVLSVAKSGHKLHPAEGEGDSSLTPSRSQVVAKRMSMSKYADLLSGPLRTPVVDMTGLKERFDFKVDLEPYLVPDAEGRRPEVAEAMRAAFQDQLGLKLERRKSEVEILVIDHAERVPTEN